jgi:hypothetical protein
MKKDINLYQKLYESLVLNSDLNITEKILLYIDLANMRRSLDNSEIFNKYFIYNLFCLPNASYFKNLQSSFLILLVYLRILFSKKVKSSSEVCEYSRFGNFSQSEFSYFLPSSLKQFILILFTKKSILKPSSFLYAPDYLSHPIRFKYIFSHTKKFNSSKILSFTYVLSSFLRFLLLRHIVCRTAFGIKNFTTIATVEPLQRAISLVSIIQGKGVNLFVHGLVTDPISQRQLFTKILKSQFLDIKPEYDNFYEVALQPNGKYHPIPHLSYKNVESLERLASSYEKILVFSTSYVAGTPFMTNTSIFDLLISLGCNSIRPFIRLHPGESRLLFILQYFLLFKSLPLFDTCDNKYDIAIGLPSSYAGEAILRSRYGVYIYSNVTFPNGILPYRFVQ